MIVCKGATQPGSKFRRFSRTIRLGEGLRELLTLYSRFGRGREAVVAQIDREIENCLVRAESERGAVQARLGVLYRVRDLHRFVTKQEAWAPLRHRLLEHLLLHPTLETRWAAVRGLLVEEAARVSGGDANGGNASGGDASGAPTLSLLPALTFDREGNFDPDAVKRALSDRLGPLGSLITTVALFNLDTDEEAIPDNLLLRMTPGRFPEHTWELLLGSGNGARGVNFGGGNASWQPANPLCRYEFLVADMMHALLAQWGLPLSSQQGAYGIGPVPLALDDGGGQAAEDGSWDSETPVYCRTEAGEDVTGTEPAGTKALKTMQLDLLPLEPGALPAELLRLAHRRHGAEGAKLLALLLGHLHRHRPEEAITLRLGEIAASAALHDLSARGAKTRLRRLHRIITQLEGVELTRLIELGGRPLARRNRLLTVLGRTVERESPVKRKTSAERENGGLENGGLENGGLENGGLENGGRAGKDASKEATPPTEVRVVPDPLLHGRGEREGGLENGAAALFGALPETLLDLAGSDHPSLLPLYVFLRSNRVVGDEAVPIERGAMQLLHEAGIWVSETGRYRALEALRRDLDVLVAHGWLARWRMKRGTVSGAERDLPENVKPKHARSGAKLKPVVDAMEDRIVLYPPGEGSLMEQRAGAPEGRRQVAPGSSG